MRYQNEANDTINQLIVQYIFKLHKKYTYLANLKQIMP
ncbi:Uncharacterised protein [Orientia tsutsugamushi]|nr:Uncharacterised protein [Orientia tsutsugamushi]